MQKARRRARPAPARCTDAPIAIDEHGPQDRAGRRAATATRVPRRERGRERGDEDDRHRGEQRKTRGARGHASAAITSPSTSRKPPQPTKAAAWLKKVAEGATLKAIRVGRAIARPAQSARNRSGRALVQCRGARRRRLGVHHAAFNVISDAIRLGSRHSIAMGAAKRGMIRASDTPMSSTPLQASPSRRDRLLKRRGVARRLATLERPCRRARALDRPLHAPCHSPPSSRTATRNRHGLLCHARAPRQRSGRPASCCPLAGFG